MPGSMSAGSLMAIFAASFVAGVVGSDLMRRLAVRLGVLDRPTARKSHRRSTPLLGGVAIYAAVVTAVLLDPARREVAQLAGILVAASWVSIWGLWDDRKGLHPYLKLLAQLVAAGILILAGIQVALPVPAWANTTLTLLWVVGITNAFNLLDNTDGLAGGIGAVAGATFALMAATNGQALVGSLATAIFGACLAFLLFNFNPARIFMGDSGSLFLGLTLAAVGIKLRFPANVNWVTWMVPVLVLGVPIFDTALVVLSRLRRGLNPLSASRRS